MILLRSNIFLSMGLNSVLFNGWDFKTTRPIRFLSQWRVVVTVVYSRNGSSTITLLQSSSALQLPVGHWFHFVLLFSVHTITLCDSSSILCASWPHSPPLLFYLPLTSYHFYSVADFDKKVAISYGVLLPDGMPTRALFIIDPVGR